METIYEATEIESRGSMVSEQQQVQELNELQLAFVGGGIAELVGA
jgi:hypothetical protein